MSSPAFETFLARLYTDEVFKTEFLNSPRSIAKNAGLSNAEVEAIILIDRIGLELASQSYSIKRKNIFNKQIL